MMVLKGDVPGLKELGTILSSSSTDLGNAGTSGNTAVTEVLGSGWTGGAATAFTNRWNGDSGRFPLLEQTMSEAGQAILAYAAQLQAAKAMVINVNNTADAGGILVDSDGAASMPTIAHHLPPEDQQPFQTALASVVKQVTAVNTLMQSAENTLLNALGPVLDELEGKTLPNSCPALGPAATGGDKAPEDEYTDPKNWLPTRPDQIASGLATVWTARAGAAAVLERKAEAAKTLASALGRTLRTSESAEERSMAASLLRNAGKASKGAADASDAADAAADAVPLSKGAKVLSTDLGDLGVAAKGVEDVPVIGIVGAGVGAYYDHKNGKSWAQAITSNGVATAAAITAGVIAASAGAPVIVVAVGAGLLAVGVGEGVNYVWDHAGAIGHGLEDVGKGAVHGVEDIGKGAVHGAEGAWHWATSL